MKTKRTKTTKILAGVLAFALIGIMIYFALGLMGNPISKMIVDRAAEKYVAKNYGDLDLKLEDSVYNLKDGTYIVDASSDRSIDTHFQMNFTGTGKFDHDSYKEAVLEKWNTWQRINDEYDDLVMTVLKDDLPYKENNSMGQLRDVYENFDHLELDKTYDIKEVGKEEGKLIINIESESLDKETMSEVLLGIKNIFDEKEVPFYSIDLSVEKPRAEDQPSEERIEIIDFLYEDIYIENLQERVEENIENTKELFEEQNTEKQEEIDEFEDENEKDN